MRFEMTKKEQGKLKKITERIVTPGQYLTSNIVEYYKIIAEAAHFVFHEDNDITLDDFLMEHFQKAMNEVFPYTVKFNKGMKYHIQRDVNEWIIVDEHCCVELEKARDKGALNNSQFFYDKQGGIYLSKDIPRTGGGGQLLRMNYYPFCGHKFTEDDDETQDN